VGEDHDTGGCGRKVQHALKGHRPGGNENPGPELVIAHTKFIGTGSGKRISSCQLGA